MKTLSIGSAMIDTIALVDSDRIERMSMVNADKAFLLMEEGKKTEAEAISTHIGGGAVNTAVSFARLGLNAAVLARLGADARGDNVVAGLEGEGVSTADIIRDEKTPTGASVILSSHERNAGIFTFRGANTKLVERDLNERAFTVDLVHLGSLSNQSAALYPIIVEKAKAAGARVSANPGMRQLTSRATEFLRVLPKLDILAVNRIEAEALMPALIPEAGEGGAPLPSPKPANAGAPALAARGLIGGGFEMSLARFCLAIGQYTDAKLVLTDGAHGAYIAHQGRLIFCPPGEAEIAGTAGAGDAFASTFAAMTLLGASIEDAAINASANAASVIAHMDTQSGLLGREALDARAQPFSDASQLTEWVI